MGPIPLAQAKACDYGRRLGHRRSLKVATTGNASRRRRSLKVATAKAPSPPLRG